MNRIAFAGSLLIAVFLARTGFASDPLVVDLWPGKAPGDVGINGQETSRIHPSPIVGPTKLITNVIRPTLTIYQPAKEKNTGTAMLICPGGGYHNLFWELEGEDVAAWLNSMAQPSDVILADWEASNYLAPRTPARVFGGHPVATLHVAEKQLAEETVFAHASSLQVARALGAQWLVYGPAEDTLHGPPGPAFQEFLGSLGMALAK